MVRLVGPRYDTWNCGKQKTCKRVQNFTQRGPQREEGQEGGQGKREGSTHDLIMVAGWLL